MNIHLNNNNQNYNKKMIKFQKNHMTNRKLSKIINLNIQINKKPFKINKL